MCANEQHASPDDLGVKPDAAASGPDRRSFLIWASGASLGATGVFLLGTGIQALLPPSRSIEGMTDVGPIVVARMSELKVGEPVLTQYGDDNVFVIRTSKTGVRVLDAACPHAQCTLRLNMRAQQFDCPCHGSSFTLAGARIDGPAPRGMVEAAVQVIDDRIVVSGFRS